MVDYHCGFRSYNRFRCTRAARIHRLHKPAVPSRKLSCYDNRNGWSRPRVRLLPQHHPRDSCICAHRNLHQTDCLPVGCHCYSGNHPKAVLPLYKRKNICSFHRHHETFRFFHGNYFPLQSFRLVGTEKTILLSKDFWRHFSSGTWRVKFYLLVLNYSTIRILADYPTVLVKNLFKTCLFFDFINEVMEDKIKLLAVIFWRNCEVRKYKKKKNKAFECKPLQTLPAFVLAALSNDDVVSEIPIDGQTNLPDDERGTRRLKYSLNLPRYLLHKCATETTSKRQYNNETIDINIHKKL